MARSEDEKQIRKLRAQREKNPNENLFLAGVRAAAEKNRPCSIDADRIQKLTRAAVVAFLFLRVVVDAPRDRDMAFINAKTSPARNVFLFGNADEIEPPKNRRNKKSEPKKPFLGT